MYAAFDRKDACYEYKLVGSTFLICGKLFPLMSQGAGLTDTRDARLKEILVYIQSAYSRSLSLDDIAGHVGLSRSECCRYFKSQTGQTLFEYLIQYRINKSLDILANTDTPVAQIAQAVGFSSQSYYTDMLSADSQKILNQNTEGLISYCKDVDLPVSSSLDQIKPLIEQNRYTIRFLNSNTFSASTAALAALINDDADDKEYISILNRELFKSPADTLVATSSISAGNSLDSDMVSPSASVICTILKNQTITDISVIDSDEATAPIYAAKYYTSDISAIVAPSAVYTASLTGTQIKDLLQACVVYSTTFLNGCIEPIIAYPALGGITVTMTKAGKITEIAESDGQALKGNSKYSIAVSGNIFNALTAEKNPLADSFAISSKNLQQYFTDGFVAADRLPKPSVYFKTN